MSGYGSWGMWPRYISVAERRRNAERAAKRLERKGRTLHPVATQGRAVAKTFWGKAWCDNLMSYSDYENRLPRGLSYLRNGAVLDLGVRDGLVEALVSGTDVYRVKIKIRPLDRAPWSAIKRQCAGQIGSLVDLLRGKLSAKVMEIIARSGDGLFPAPAAMTMTCSCPDWAVMCKHVAAVLYGIGTRLDEHPELLFVLRKVDHLELIAEAPSGATANGRGKSRKATAADTARLGAVFGIELAEEPAVPGQAVPGQAPKSRTAAKTRVARKTPSSRGAEQVTTKQVTTKRTTTKSTTKAKAKATTTKRSAAKSTAAKQKAAKPTAVKRQRAKSKSAKRKPRQA